MHILKPYQERAVENLLHDTTELLSQKGVRHRMLFQAPTGAGKTTTMAHFLSQLCEQLHAESRQVAFIWIAPFKLHIQSFRAFERQFEHTRILNPIEVSGITDRRLMPNQVLFLNWESINKKGNTFVQENEQGFNLYSVVNETRMHSTEVIVIIDEEHLFVKAPKTQEVLKNLRAKIEIGVSATPETKSDYHTRIKRAEVVKSQMIKQCIILNPDLDPAKQGDEHKVDTYLIDIALAKRQELQEAYQALGKKIRPLLLIQLPNDTKEDLTLDDKKYIDTILHYLDYRGFTVQNKRVAKWFSNEKQNLEGIERLDNTVDVLLFKQAVAMGWDCPRAAVLLIFREMKALSFTIQTVGRILRMPEQTHYSNELLNIGYVYTNLVTSMIEVVRDESDYMLKDYAKRIEGYSSVALASAHINTRIFRNRLRVTALIPAMREVLEKGWGFVHGTALEGAHETNRASMQGRMLHLDVSRIEIALPTDVTLTGEEQAIDVTKKARFAKTESELEGIYKLFCKANVGDYEKTNSPHMLGGNLLHRLGEYTGFHSWELTKIILYPQNTPHFIDLIEKILIRHEEILRERAKNSQKEYENYAWEVPEGRAYNSEYYEALPAPKHVLQPYYAYQQASLPEKWFTAEIEKEANTPHIHWWYKNGDKGKEHFAIPYTNNKGEPSLFYIDFVISFAVGKIGLFDTKTLNSDPEAPAKHNALIAYCEAENAKNKDRQLVGSLLIPTKIGETLVFHYILNRIEHTHDTRGWQVFIASKF